MVNYYGKYLRVLSSMVAPLYALLQKNSKWKWHQDQNDAFKMVKQKLTSPKLLIHYYPQQKLLLSCGIYLSICKYGIGAVISQVMDDGSGQPIAYASCSLSMAKKAFSNRKRRAGLCLWSKEISPISLWTAIHNCFRPPGIVTSVQ